MGMNRLERLYAELLQRGLTPEQQRIVKHEMKLARAAANLEQMHRLPFPPPKQRSLYGYSDLTQLQGETHSQVTSLISVHALDYLLSRDLQREKDGFPRKIRVGRMVKPGKDGDDKVVVVPTTVEEKLLHDRVRVGEDEEGEGQGEGGGEGGAGEGEEGEIIGEQPVRPEEGGGQGGAGQGEGGAHELESSAYDLGRILTEQFQLPNLKDKGKRRSLSKYTYDLTDKNHGFGQVLDKKATLRQIVQTNIALGRLRPNEGVDPGKLLVSPRDRIYRILSREKDYESQAVVFFVRDYSGSMSGKPTELVVNQHVLIYAWLTYQYENQVETRFILHDTEAKEVDDFQTYAGLKVAGGTQVSSAYKLVNTIVEEESLARDYNIYVFHGTDGDDWDSMGEQSLPELRRMLTYANRIGITIAENSYGITGRSEVERYVRKSGLLEEASHLLRLDVMPKDSTEPRIIEGIKALIS